MSKYKSTLGLAFTLILSTGILISCQGLSSLSGSTTLPNNPSTSNPPITAVPQTGNPTAAPALSTVPAKTVPVATELQNSVIQVLAVDAAFQDTDTLSTDGFTTAALPLLPPPSPLPIAKPSLQPMLVKPSLTPNPLPSLTPGSTTTRPMLTPINMMPQAAKARILSQKNFIEASGAVKVNADGSVTIQPAKLKESVHNRIESRATHLKAHVAKIQDKLQTLKPIEPNQIGKLRRKAYQAKISNSVTANNPDSTVTKTLKVSFSNLKGNLTREVTVVKTFKDGNTKQPLTTEYILKESTRSYTKEATRLVTHIQEQGFVTAQATGTTNSVTATVNTYSKTTGANGKTLEANVETIFSRDKTASSNAVLTLKTEAGQTSTYNVSSSTDANGQVTTTATDTATNTAVTVDEQPATTSSGTTATVTTTENGQTTASTTVDLQTAEEMAATTSTPTTATPAPNTNTDFTKLSLLIELHVENPQLPTDQETDYVIQLAEAARANGITLSVGLGVHFLRDYSNGATVKAPKYGDFTLASLVSLLQNTYGHVVSLHADVGETASYDEIIRYLPPYVRQLNEVGAQGSVASGACNEAGTNGGWVKGAVDSGVTTIGGVVEYCQASLSSAAYPNYWVDPSTSTPTRNHDASPKDNARQRTQGWFTNDVTTWITPLIPTSKDVLNSSVFITGSMGLTHPVCVAEELAGKSCGENTTADQAVADANGLLSDLAGAVDQYRSGTKGDHYHTAFSTNMVVNADWLNAYFSTLSNGLKNNSTPNGTSMASAVQSSSMGAVAEANRLEAGTGLQ